MEHVVFYTGPDRSPQFRRAPSLDEAVRFVESLRNGEGIDDSKVYSLSEVPLRFQTYYRVEVPAEGGPAASSPSMAPPLPDLPPATPAPAAAPAPAAPPAPEPTAFAPVEPKPAAAASPFESVAVGAEASAAPQLADPVAVETLPPAPPAAEVGAAEVPDLVNGTAEDEGDGQANGKHRGLGFFAR